MLRPKDEFKFGSNASVRQSDFSREVVPEELFLTLGTHRSPALSEWRALGGI